MKNHNENRRSFLKKVSVGTCAIVVFPTLVSASKALNNKGEVATTAVNGNGFCNRVTLDYYGQGPFYTPNAPELADNKLAATDEPGTRLSISGVVRTLDCNQIIPNTTIDLWHANGSGSYDNVGYNLRGKVKTDAEGRYQFETILPGKYLNGNKHRPRHIHVKVSPPNSPELITQIYFKGDADIEADAAASINSGTYDATHRILETTTNQNGELEAVWDIVIDGVGVSSVEQLHVDKGMIYDVSPNPFVNTLKVRYSAFEHSKVLLQLFDSAGKLIDVLDDKYVENPEETIVWTPSQYLPKGMYWLVMQVNGLHVHSKKIIKQ